MDCRERAGSVKIPLILGTLAFTTNVNKGFQSRERFFLKEGKMMAAAHHSSAARKSDIQAFI
jgi:hypothetical protein